VLVRIIAVIVLYFSTLLQPDYSGRPDLDCGNDYLSTVRVMTSDRIADSLYSICVELVSTYGE
jgi:hypothetical protein